MDPLITRSSEFGVSAELRAPSVDHLIKNARQYSFFEAVRLLQALHPDAPKLGRQGPPERERIRLRPLLSLGFPTSDIESAELIGEHASGAHDAGAPTRYRLDVTFLGLYGPSSPLPVHYTEDMVRHEEDESLLRGFLDIFHHRLLSLLYRAWEKYRHSVQFDAAGNDYFSRRLPTLAGLGHWSLNTDCSVPSGRMLEYLGLLSLGASAESLRAMLQAHFPDAPVRIEQCVGAWARIPADQCSRRQLRRAHGAA
jgi:type VI secretion system protein ImpH